MGYASAMAVLLLAVSFAVTLVIIRQLAPLGPLRRGGAMSTARRRPAPLDRGGSRRRAVRRRSAPDRGREPLAADRRRRSRSSRRSSSSLLTALMTNDQALSSHLWPQPVPLAELRRRLPPGAALALDAQHADLRGLATLGVLVSSIPVAYALARLRWRGRNVVFLRRAGRADAAAAGLGRAALRDVGEARDLVGTLWPLIIPNWFGDAFSIFLLRQFFLTIPEEYLDAARVDGCGELRILDDGRPAAGQAGDRRGRAVLLPLHLQRLLPPAALPRARTRTTGSLSLGLSQFRSLHQVQWNLTMAATLLVMAPVIVVFFLAQKAFVEGVTLTGVKG